MFSINEPCSISSYTLSPSTTYKARFYTSSKTVSIHNTLHYATVQVIVDVHYVKLSLAAPKIHYLWSNNV